MVGTSALPRATAERFRALAGEGEDLFLKAALIELADDFDREATEIDARSPAHRPFGIAG
jgi:hypothetical protein